MEKSIGPNGGDMQTDYCAVNFPQGAVTKEGNISVTTFKEEPPDDIPIEVKN